MKTKNKFMALALSLFLLVGVLVPGVTETRAADETITVSIEGYDNGDPIATFTEGADTWVGCGKTHSEDQAVWNGNGPIMIDPLQALSQDGQEGVSSYDATFAAYVKENHDKGLELKWHYKDTEIEVKWLETTVSGSHEIVGTWAPAECTVTVSYDGLDEPIVYAVPYNSTLKDEGISLPKESDVLKFKKGHDFLGWLLADESGYFDENTKVTDNIAVYADYHMVDNLEAELEENFEDKYPEEISGKCYVRRPVAGSKKFKTTINSGALKGKTVYLYCQRKGAAWTEGSLSYTAERGEIKEKADGTLYATYTITVKRDPVAAVGSRWGYQLLRGEYKVSTPVGGKIEIEKKSDNPDITNNNDCYSLDGVRFGIYKKKISNTEVDQDSYVNHVTIKNGKGSISKFPAGTYYIQEMEGFKGSNYAWNDKVEEVTVKAGKTVKFEFENTPLYDPVTVLLEKRDNDTLKTTAQGDASLEGARFVVEYYDEENVNIDGMYKSREDAGVMGEPKHEWIFKTDKDGYINVQNSSYHVGGDELILSEKGSPLFPIGTYIIYEETAPEGYLKNENEFFLRNVYEPEEGSGGVPIVKTFNALTEEEAAVREPVIRGGIQIQKWDKELNKSEALGGASLEGIEFTITNRSENSVVVGDVEYEPGKVVKKITTKWNEKAKAYVAETSADCLPYGTYDIQETKTNDSYLLTDGKVRTFKIENEGEIVTKDVGGELLAAVNQVKRGDFKLVKIANTTSERLSVPFVVENIKTGESRVIVTDKNGQYSSASSWNPHSQETNANDNLKNKENITAEDMNYDAGLWFSKGEFGSDAPVDDNLGALPYGQYRITELKCEANKDFAMQSWTFWIEKNGREVDLGTITNDLPPSIGTTATDKDTGEHITMARENVTIVDTVTYSGLKAKEEYTMKGVLMDKNTGEPLLVDGKKVTAEKTFKAKAEIGTVEMEFTFDATSFGEDFDVVVFEYLMQGELAIASHEDIEDEDQTVKFIVPKIETTALDIETGDHITFADGKAEVVDTVEYSGLMPGVEVTVTGKMMDKATGEPMKDAEGKEITAETTFTPEEMSGTVDVHFTFDASRLAGATGVVFEQLLFEKDIVATHEDIDDEDQTIYFPEIKTSVSEGEEKDVYVSPNGEVTMTDTIKYKNLIPGLEYEVTGSLIDKSTSKEIKTAKTTFTPEEADGEAGVTFTFDATGLEGKSIVVFEKLFLGEAQVAEHCDPDDAEQIFHVRGIGTQALDSETEAHISYADGEATIIDTVKYENLEVGVEHTLVGTLVNKADGKALTDKDGNVITAETTFTPEKPDGTVDVVFTIDASDLAGKTYVAFEELYTDEGLVEEHKDPNDEEQTIYFPEIKTLAFVGDEDNKTITKDRAKVIDRVTYKNLVPGEKYILTAALIDKETGDCIATGEAKFKAKEANGYEDVKIKFNADEFDGKELVVYETLWYTDDKIASHEDINDKDQTVKVDIPKAPQTGSSIPPYIWIVIAALGVSAVAVIFMRKKSK